MSSDSIQISIINSALEKCGSPLIVTLTDDTARRISATTIFDEVRDKLLNKYPWNFAIKRKTLTPPAEKTLTSITYSGTTATATLVAHGYATDMYITISGATPTNYNGTFPITASTDTFTYTMDEAPTSNASGTIKAQLVPGFEYDNLFSLPSDCLRVLEMFGISTPYVIEDRYIMSDEEEINIKYIKQVIDYTLYPSTAKVCLSLALAAEIAPKITGDKMDRIKFLQELEIEILEAFKMNVFEGNPNISKDMQGVSSGDYSWQKER